jgi:hypothetical protein
MDERIKEITSEMSQVTADARAAFGAMTAEQLNWKPAENGWSIGQCFDHIIRTNEQFYPEFNKLSTGTRQNSFWENWSPISGWAGRFLIDAVSIDSKKAKAPSKSIVPPSDIEAGIIDRFGKHVAEVNSKIESCAAADRLKTIVTSPFLSIFTYCLEDAYTVLVEHTKRHFRQAMRVTQADGFPSGN